MPSPQRFAALQQIQRRRPVATAPAASLEDLWASDVFTLDRMKAVLPGRVYKSVRGTIEKGGSWGAGIEFTGGICPLTPLENQLRALAHQQGYAGGFVEHYVFGLLYPEGLTRNVQLALGLLVLVVNAVVYAWAWRRQRRPART